jgi:TRAP-type mannitol/chloroaromatic compound transport system permease small subunit
MPKVVKLYVRFVDTLNHYVGLVAMYLVFAMIAVLLYSTFTKYTMPALWTLEMAQFIMVAYFLLGGGYSMQMNSHVRMDLLYSRWSPRFRASVDSFTILFLVFYLVMLLLGGIASTQYSLRYGERTFSAWAPYTAPIKIIMCVGITLMLLQAIAMFFRNIAEARGDPLPAAPGDQQP